jgi:dUTP pyrophosphatase
MTAAPTPLLRLKRLHAAAVLPAYQTPGSAGLDLAACLPEGATLTVPARAGGIVLVPCGFAMALPAGWEGQVRPRSGLASKHGVTLPNAPGTIDADYRGEVKVPLINHGPEPFMVTHALRVAQLVVAPVARATVEEVGDLDATDRGEGGFGSTGLAAPMPTAVGACGATNAGAR